MSVTMLLSGLPAPAVTVDDKLRPAMRKTDKSIGLDWIRTNEVLDWILTVNGFQNLGSGPGWY